MSIEATESNVYSDGSYLEKTGGTWHLEDSPFKARQIAAMLGRHPEIHAGTVCEIGCGAGGVLVELQKLLPARTSFTGYDISPQAHALSVPFSNDHCRFVLGDAFKDPTVYDLVLVIDVIEHLEDCFSFLRGTRRMGHWKIFHVPLDAHASAVLRGITAWDSVGHLHLFTIETALKSIEYAGLRVIDWSLTDGAMALPNRSLKTRLMNLARWPVAKISRKFSARFLGGFSILILAE